MKEKITDIFYKITAYIVIALPFVVGIALFIVWIYAFITYGDKPITEIPSWAFFFLGR